jgi:hypothetical protein
VGIPRTKEKIVAELDKQVKLACAGVVKPVKYSQTQTGVKGIYTQHWIDFFLNSRTSRRASPTELIPTSRRNWFNGRWIIETKFTVPF